jgi:UDP-N-acetylglucosamine transferase subunit ALG13
MIFVTVGSMIPFDRLIKALDVAVGKDLVDEELFAQVGKTEFKPQHIRYVDVLERETYIRQFKSANAIISHAGMGTIAMADKYEMPLLVLPRLARYGEHVNDHQVQSAKAFANQGYFLLAKNTDDLIDKIKELNKFIPKKRVTQTDAVIQLVSRFLSQIRVT